MYIIVKPEARCTKYRSIFLTESTEKWLGKMTWNYITEACGVWYIYKSKEEMFYCKQMHYCGK